MNIFEGITRVFVHNDYGYLSHPYNGMNGEYVISWASTLTTTVAAIHYGMRPNADVIIASAIAILYGSFASFLATYPRVFIVSMATATVVCASRMVAKSIEG